MTLLTAEDYQRFPVVAPDYRYAYGEHSEQFGELTLPDSTPPHPVIALIHGGGYREMYNLRPLGSVVSALARAGFAVWNIEYRRFGNGGDFPRMFLDVAGAADHLREIAATHELDLGRVISMGHSAGGHLALWLAGRRRVQPNSPLYVEEPLAIHGVVALAPLADVSYGSENRLSGDDALLAVMGGPASAAPQAYRNGCPAQLLPLGCPHTTIVGSEDVDMLRNARRFIIRAQKTDDAARLVELPGAGHFEIVAVPGDAWQAVMRSVREMSENLRASCG